ncbi:PEP-CTERM protein-sorting domain-containing protein [Nitrosospira multiformis]|uniref:PEP-CTERM protein-sorting domain-containing protein n=2 Tax=Nitrosospira multiformis TaxID=1231 RepID=A0A1H8QKQ8_9PROT|nr:PEP-CTERM protein-sorting domain-containing protein [Nitrosospira multiformis]
MKATILIAALIIVMATGPTHAGLISVVPSLETTVGTTSDVVIDTTLATADTTLGFTVETTPEASEGVTSDSTAEGSVSLSELLLDDMIASFSAEVGADTTISSVDANADLNISSVDVNADLNIGLNGNDNGLNGNKIPEPGTVLLVGIGLAALITRTRQKVCKKGTP